MWCCVAYGAQTCFVTKSYAYINSMTTTWVWKPFYRYFVHFRRSWDTKATTINAFTTFLLLSFSKAYLYPSHSCTFVVHYGILLKVFLVLQCTMECSCKCILARALVLTYPDRCLTSCWINPLPSIRNSQNKQNPCTTV